MLEEFINKQIQEYLHSKNVETNLWIQKGMIRIYETLLGFRYVLIFDKEPFFQFEIDYNGFIISQKNLWEDK